MEFKYKIGDVVECFERGVKKNIGIVSTIPSGAHTTDKNWYKVLISYDSNLFTKNRKYAMGTSYEFKKIGDKESHKAINILFSGV